MIADPWFYVAAIPAVFILGLGKGGFGMVGVLVIPILSIVVSPVQAAGITLPILILSDVVAVASYWRQWDTRLLATMVPGALLGVATGWLTAEMVTESAIRLIVGIVAIAFALNYWLRARLQTTPGARNPVKATVWSAVSGFTSFVSHAGGPPFQVYVAPLRLPPRTFAATSVIFFTIVNALKAVPYFFLGQFGSENLITSAILLPVSIPATLFGVWLIRRIDAKAFYRVIYALILVAGAIMVLQGVGAFN